MFHACAVKIAKIDAHSAPSWLPGNRCMKKATVKVRKPSTGTDCRMSSAGTITSSARLFLAASVAMVKVNSSDASIAANIRKVVRRPYSGSRDASSVTGACARTVNGACISPTPWAIRAIKPMIRTKATVS